MDSLLCLQDLARVDLIISDDASTDGTTGIIGDWLQLHSGKFHKARLVENRDNGGISANHKIAFDHAETKYGLYIGADDLCCNPAMVGEILSLLDNREIGIARLRVQTLTLPTEAISDMYGPILHFFKLNAARQFSALALHGNFLYAGPGTILNIPLLQKISGFDPRFRSFEDFPLFLNFLIRGHKIHLLDIRGIYWVRSEHSLSATGFTRMKDQFTTDLQILYRDFVDKNLKILSPWARLLYRAKTHRFLFRVIQKISRTWFGYPR